MAEESKRINVIRPDGNIVSLPSEMLETASAEGYKLASDKDVRYQDLRKEYGKGFDNQLKAFASEAAMTVPYVGGKLLEKAGVTQEAYEARKEFFPKTSLAGAAVGIGAQTAVTSPLSALSAAGTATEMAATRALGSFGSKLAGSAVEGALYGLGSAVNESALGDHDLTAEGAVAAMGTGALFAAGGRALFLSAEKASKLVRDYAMEHAIAETVPGASKAGKFVIEKIADELPIPGTVKRLIFDKAIHKIEEVGVLNAIEQASQKTLKNIESSASAIAKSKALPYLSADIGLKVEENNKEDRVESFKTIQERLLDLNNSPELFMDTIASKTSHMFDFAPNVAAGIQASAVRAVTFLQSKLPKQPEQQPFEPEWVPNQTEINTFFKYYDAVERPTEILNQIKTGTLSEQSVEAVKQVHPKLYEAMQSAVLDKVTAKKNKIPYRTKLMISMFLGQPLVNSLNPKSILSNQIAAIGPSQQSGDRAIEAGNSTQTGLNKISIANRSLTPMQRSNQRNQKP